MPDLKTMTISTLTFSVESEMSGDLFTCEAINDHFNSVQTVETKMFVERKFRGSGISRNNSI